MSEKIEVVYSEIIPGSVYHKTLVYTNSAGKRFFVTAEPENGDIFAKVSGITVNLTKEMGYSVFGRINSFNGTLDEITVPDFFNSYDSDNKELIAQSADLSTQWSAIVSAYNEIEANNVLYIPTSQNSNATADFALHEADFPSLVLPGHRRKNGACRSTSNKSINKNGCSSRATS